MEHHVEQEQQHYVLDGQQVHASEAELAAQGHYAVDWSAGVDASGQLVYHMPQVAPPPSVPNLMCAPQRAAPSGRTRRLRSSIRQTWCTMGGCRLPDPPPAAAPRRPAISNLNMLITSHLSNASGNQQLALSFQPLVNMALQLQLQAWQAASAAGAAEQQHEAAARYHEAEQVAADSAAAAAASAATQAGGAGAHGIGEHHLQQEQAAHAIDELGTGLAAAAAAELALQHQGAAAAEAAHADAAAEVFHPGGEDDAAGAGAVKAEAAAAELAEQVRPAGSQALSACAARWRYSVPAAT